MTNEKRLQYAVIIAPQKKKNKFLSLLADLGAHGVETVYAHGSMSPGALSAAFGLEAEQGKVMVSGLLRYEKAEELMALLYRDHKFSEPNTGIAFCVPVEGLAF